MSVTAASRWLASGVHAGTKPGGELDLALVYSELPATVAGAFTTNKAECAHIQLCRSRVASGAARGVVVSAGIADAATGAEGIDHAAQLAAEAADACGVDEQQMLVCLTGKIGPRLPIDDLLPAVGLAAKSLAREGHDDAARAIWTTDTKLKQSVRTVAVGGRHFTVGGMAKGAAMIAPEMRVVHKTMLAFVTTDAIATPDVLRTSLADALPTTFNAMTVDGSRSTNDTVFLFANGASGLAADSTFGNVVREVMADLAYAIASDGEGCTMVIRMRVTGAASTRDAECAARELANSVLLRCALWAGEAKWGWVIQQLGQADIAFDQDRVAVSICGVELARNGTSSGRDDEAKALLGPPEIVVHADLGLGDGSFDMLTCDITPEFPKLQLGT